MNHPKHRNHALHLLRKLTRRERIAWGASLFLVTGANLAAGRPDSLTLAAAWVGITSLLFAAKGLVLAQLLMIVFSLLYGGISLRFRYWGEMITYLGMSLPMAVWSAVTWYRHAEANTVAIRHLRGLQMLGVFGTSLPVTGAFYFVLRALDTPNLLFSTVSVTTSFLAAALTMLRSSYYALGYAANDLVLIVLWSLAALQDPRYLPMVLNFAIFFLNDLYGFFCWKKRERLQPAD